MKEKILQWIVCPICGNTLNINISLQNKEEIVEGFLYCSCQQKFPIIKGVPRLLSKSLCKNIEKLYPDFFNRYPNLVTQVNYIKESHQNRKKVKTIDRFGYEWTQFSDYDCDNFRTFISPLPPEFFKGKLGLDVGCGAGRHAHRASEHGAEILAVDLSQAVDAAYDNNIDNDLVHVIQADVYNLPFKHGTFDFIYSLGVLHHLPKPESGYNALIPFLKKRGAIFIWLYAYAPRKLALEILRFISQHLSNNNIKRMAYLCNLIDYGIFINLYRLLKNMHILSPLINHYCPLRIKEYAEYGFQVSYTDWFDRLSAPITNYYKKNEMNNWLLRSGLCNTQLQAIGDSWWWLYGEKGLS